jgi:hypothetical protein
MCGQDKLLHGMARKCYSRQSLSIITRPRSGCNFQELKEKKMYAIQLIGKEKKKKLLYTIQGIEKKICIQYVVIYNTLFQLCRNNIGDVFGK